MARSWGIVVAPIAVGCGMLTGAGDLRVSGEVTPTLDGALDADGGTDGDVVASPPFCATVTPPPFLCHDFETVGLPGPWDSVVTMRNGTVTVENVGSSSARSVLFHVPAIPGGMGADQAAALVRDLGPLPSRIVVSLDVLVVETPTQFEAFDLIAISTGDLREFGVEILPSGAVRFDEDIPADGGEGQILTPTTAVVSQGTWTSVRLVVDIMGAVTRAEIFVNGASHGVAPPPDIACFGPDAELFVGDNSVNSLSTTWRVRADNVVVEKQ